MIYFSRGGIKGLDSRDRSCADRTHLIKSFSRRIGSINRLAADPLLVVSRLPFTSISLDSCVEISFKHVPVMLVFKLAIIPLSYRYADVQCQATARIKRHNEWYHDVGCR